MPYLTPELPFQSGSETSREAAIRAQKFVGQQGEAVLTWFHEQGVRGGTQKEAAKATGVERPSMCARVRALEQCGALRKTSEKRAGCFVYVTTEAHGS